MYCENPGVTYKALSAYVEVDHWEKEIEEKKIKNEIVLKWCVILEIDLYRE